MELLSPLIIESVVLPANLGFLILERFTCWKAITKTFKIFQLKKLYSVLFNIPWS